jgi:site-specific DNA-cytosine methylase
MKILELFCGTKSFSKVAEARGHEVVTVDIEQKFNPTICCDILDFDVSMLKGFKPDVIWASPPCATFSVASIGKHWKGGKKAYIPKSKEAEIGLQILNKTKVIIYNLQPKYFIIENPRGMMRKFITPELRTTVTYCQYGDSRMKPTDLWTNFGFVGKKCKNGDKCHISAPRGSKTGTQGLKGSIQRSIIPEKLCKEILNHLEKELSSKQEGEDAN